MSLFVILLVVSILIMISLFVTMWALVVAIRRPDWVWAAIIGGALVFIFPLAPIVAGVYLIAYRDKGPTPYAERRAARKPQPEGWYDDPGGEYDMRWWNGSDWTDQVMDNGVNRTRPRIRH